jgi:hypothetical protein
LDEIFRDEDRKVCEALRRSEWVRQIAPPLLFSVDGRG